MRQTIGIIAVVMLLGGFVWFAQTQTPVEYEQEKREVITQEVTPEWAVDEDAVAAAQAVIRRKELEAMEAELVAEITERQEALNEIRKELGSY
jgi:hypothetical protein